MPGKHEILILYDKVPHSVFSVSATFPGSQDLQEAAPVSELIMLPTQDSHFVLSADRYFPAAHGSEISILINFNDQIKV